MLKKTLKNKKGQSTVEYLLIIAVIVVVIAAFGKVAQEKIKTVANTVFDGVNKNIQGLMQKAQQ